VAPPIRNLTHAFELLERGEQLDEALTKIFGVEVHADGLPTEDPPRVPMLRYDVPRRIDLLALRRGARAVAKFEDLSGERAGALQRSLPEFETVLVGPYGKRFDIVEDQRAGQLYTVIAGRGTIASEVAEAERDRSEQGTRRAGQLLGYPSCCIEMFVEVSRDASEGINEAAIRAFARGPIPWQLNPLSTDSPIGFMPCSPSCRAARDFAERILNVVDDRAVLERTLRRPILFFRYAAFFVIEGDRLFLNGAGSVTTVERWAHHIFGTKGPVSLARTLRVGPHELNVCGDPRLLELV
jgi:hypothetical protein